MGDSLMSSDISWNDLIYELSEGVLSFRMNAISNALPSTNNLRRWGFKSHGRRPLCNAKCATAAHILNNCYVALIQNRYTWRHDNVLKGIHKHLVGIVRKANRENASPRKKIKAQNFIKKGTNPKPRKKQKLSIHTDFPTDWQVNFDFNNNATIPPETSVLTLQRPDIVIFSVSKKRIIWLENTVPLERNIVDAQLRKIARYAKLKTALKLKGWTVEDFTIEIGALGFIAKSFDFALRRLGFGKTQRKYIRKVAGKLSLKSSFNIWCNRFSSDFIKPKLTPEPKSHTFPPIKQKNFSQTSPPSKQTKLKRTPFCPRIDPPSNIKPISTPIKITNPNRNPLPEHKYFTPISILPKVQYISPLSTFSKLMKEKKEMSPIDSTLWNGIDNYSPYSRNWLDTHIPLYRLDDLMELNPFANSLRYYDPTISPAPFISKKKMSEEIM